VFVFEFIMRNLRTYFVDVAGKNADVIIASRLLEQLMSMKLASKGPSTGAMANNLREFESLREFFTSGTLVALVDLPFIFLFVGVIFLISGPIAFIPLIAVPLVILVGIILQFPLRTVIERTHRESTQKHALLVETIDGLETIKASAAEGRMQRAWERFVGLTAESSGKARFLSGLATTFAQVSIQLCTVTVVVYGVHLIAKGDITMGALVASTILAGRALAPLGSIAGMLTRLQQSRVALKSLDAIMKSPVERPAGKTFLHRPRLSGEIEVQKLSFSYPNQESKALDDVSIQVGSGERVGILGRIGSGKSTIARLLIGLYDPAEGAVLMDGTDIRQIDPADLRRNVGYVSQDNYLFFGSVRDNIAFGAPHLDDNSVLRAAQVAGVTDFLRAHPHGFDMQVGERGMGLSGGQRQSIVIARALLQDPPIIVLDEPTSNMDNSSEAAFKQRLGQILPGKTLVLITHRSSLLSLVDRLIIFDAGKVVADGPKDEVLNALKHGQIRASRG
jgi:ATP-binding cassette, subfamily C, bacterial LapB